MELTGAGMKLIPEVCSKVYLYWTSCLILKGDVEREIKGLVEVEVGGVGGKGCSTFSG